jgi:PKD repeat protein
MRRHLLIMLAIAACSKSEAPVLDAGAERASFDLPPPQPDRPVSLAVDFTIENCPSFDPVALTCTGPAPLIVRFVPLATATVTKYLWDFGDHTVFDGTTAPSHVYTTPGVYNVQVIATGVSGGFVTKAHPGFIVALPNPLGKPCETTAQCDSMLFCLCPASAGCTGAPPYGQCASLCTSGLCDDEQVCAGLRTAEPPLWNAEPWQTSLCLPHCEADSDCDTGLRCRTLPPGPEGSAWVRACFWDTPRDVGEPCTDSDGNRRDDFCATGMCAELGALGMCTMDCRVSSCPQGSDCAAFGDGRRLCLRPCSGKYVFPCDRDPLLICTNPTTGDLGYQTTLNNGAQGSRYCAPSPCVSDDDCRPSGNCATTTGVGHCVKR